MPNPDLVRIQALHAQALAQSRVAPDPHSDGRAYFDTERDASNAWHQAQDLARELARLEQEGRALRQKIGIARRQLGTPDDSHAARVWRLTGERARTTADCTLPELRLILDEYRAAGWQPRPPARAGRSPSADALDRNALLRKVQALLADQQLPWSYAEAILRRQRGLPAGTRCPVELLDADQARALIAALARRQKKQGGAPA